jgi:tripartite-type tricarboxylate transporter receptor subunit TctC
MTGWAWRRLTAVLGATCVLSLPAAAEDFYKDKTIQVVVASTTGGGYDAYGRLVARHLGNAIPGKPKAIVQNMPGASGVKAVNYVYGIAPKDGTVIGAFDSSTPFQQALGYPGIQFKAEEMSWIGSWSQVVNVLIVLDTAGVRTLEDAKRKEVLMGALSMVGTNAAYPLLLNNMLGTKFKLVTGYQSGTELNLALERGEVEGRGSNPWTSWKSTRPDWIASGKIVPLMQIGPTRDPELPNVPLLTDLAQNEEQKKIFELMSANIAIERPFAGPPELPADRLLILRDGFIKLGKNAEFLAEAKKMDIDIDPLPGERVAQIVSQIVSTPPDIAAKVKAAIGEK